MKNIIINNHFLLLVIVIVGLCTFLHIVYSIKELFKKPPRITTAEGLQLTLQELIQCQKMNGIQLTLGLLFLFIIALLRAWLAWFEYTTGIYDYRWCHIVFGVNEGGILTLGIIGWYWGVIIIWSFLQGISLLSRIDMVKKIQYSASANVIQQGRTGNRAHLLVLLIGLIIIIIIVITLSVIVAFR